MTRKDNALALLHHESVEHIVDYMADFFHTGGNKETFENGPEGGGCDDFGVLWECSESALGQGVPAAGGEILDDIEDWEELVHFPDPSKVDWEGMAREQLAGYDPQTQVHEYGMWNGPFLRLMHLMGFQEGLCAMACEPEAAHAFMEAYTQYRVSTIPYVVKYFHPDVICLYDDFATERSLFISPETYREMIKPYHKIFFDAVKSYGVIPNMHVCGKCADVVPDFIDEGIGAWEICQPENDLVSLQKKVGKNVSFMGGYDMIGRASYQDVTEEELRASVRATIDAYAPGRNYGFMGMIMYSDPYKMINTMQILSDECVKYGTDYYKRHGM